MARLGLAFIAFILVSWWLVHLGVVADCGNDYRCVVNEEAPQ